MLRWDSLSGRSKAIWIGIVALIVYSAVVRQLRADGYDFLAYYRGAELWLSGQNPYQYFESFNFKYAPSSLLIFAPFTLFPYEISRWLYIGAHVLMTLSIPLIIWNHLKADKILSPKLDANQFTTALFIGLIGTLRFVDEEYWLSQFGLPILWGMLLGLVFLFRENRYLRGLGIFTFSLFAQVKIHSLVSFLSFVNFKKPRNWIWIALLAAIPCFLPKPELWLKWRDLMTQSTPDISFGSNLQGFFALTQLVFGWGESSAKTFFLIVPLFLMLLAFLPRFSVSQAKTHRAAFLLTIFSWMLFGLMTSLLPWRYTYSVTWFFFALSWVVGTAKEQRWILGLCLFLGLTPSGIVTHEISRPLEFFQIPFIAMMLHLVIMVGQARRLSRIDPSKLFHRK